MLKGTTCSGDDADIATLLKIVIARVFLIITCSLLMLAFFQPRHPCLHLSRGRYRPVVCRLPSIILDLRDSLPGELILGLQDVDR